MTANILFGWNSMFHWPYSFWHTTICAIPQTTFPTLTLLWSRLHTLWPPLSCLVEIPCFIDPTPSGIPLSVLYHKQLSLPWPYCDLGYIHYDRHYPVWLKFHVSLTLLLLAYHYLCYTTNNFPYPDPTVISATYTMTAIILFGWNSMFHWPYSFWHTTICAIPQTTFPTLTLLWPRLHTLWPPISCLVEIPCFIDPTPSGTPLSVLYHKQLSLPWPYCDLGYIHNDRQYPVWSKFHVSLTLLLLAYHYLCYTTNNFPYPDPTVTSATYTMTANILFGWNSMFHWPYSFWHTTICAIPQTTFPTLTLLWPRVHTQWPPISCLVEIPCFIDLTPSGIPLSVLHHKQLSLPWRHSKLGYIHCDYHWQWELLFIRSMSTAFFSKKIYL